MKLEEYLHLLGQSEDPEQAFEVFKNTLNSFGFDRISYTLCTDHPSLELKRQHGLSTSYPESWMKHYVENNYLDVDPVVKELLNKNQIFRWDDILKKYDKESSSHTMMMEAEDANVTEGIGISITTPYEEITGVGIARSQRTKEKLDDHVLSLVYFYTMNFHQTYRKLIAKKLANQFSIRQKEILHWATLGKTDMEMAIILNVSYATIRYHWNKLFETMNVNSRSQAIEKAIHYNIFKGV